MSTLTDSVAEGLSALQARRDALRRQETRVRRVRVLIVSAFFAVVMGANLYLGAVVVMGSLRAEKDPKAATRSAIVSRTLLDGTFCRAIMYDNELAQTTSDKVVPCEELRPRRRGNTMFNWGKE